MPCGYVEKIPIFRKCTLNLVLKELDVGLSLIWFKRERESSNTKTNGIKR